MDDLEKDMKVSQKHDLFREYFTYTNLPWYFLSRELIILAETAMIIGII